MSQIELILREAIQYVPFVSLANSPIEEQRGASMWTHPLFVRLLEAAIIAGVVLYGTVQSATQHITTLREDLIEVKVELKEIRSQLRMAEQELWRRKGLDKLDWKYAGKSDVPETMDH
jgi:hypothetical protein